MYCTLLGSTIGRLAFYYISDYTTGKITLAGLIGVNNLVTCILNIIFAFTSGNVILFCALVTCVGLNFGVYAVVNTALNVDMFGVTYVAVNDGIFDFSGAIGSFTVSYVFLSIFPVPVDDDVADDDLGCRGTHCFNKVFLLSAGICFIAFLVSLPLNRFLMKERNLI